MVTWRSFTWRLLTLPLPLLRGVLQTPAPAHVARPDRQVPLVCVAAFTARGEPLSMVWIDCDEGSGSSALCVERARPRRVCVQDAVCRWMHARRVVAADERELEATYADTVDLLVAVVRGGAADALAAIWERPLRRRRCIGRHRRQRDGRDRLGDRGAGSGRRREIGGPGLDRNFPDGIVTRNRRLEPVRVVGAWRPFRRAAVNAVRTERTVAPRTVRNGDRVAHGLHTLHFPKLSALASPPR